MSSIIFFNRNGEEYFIGRVDGIEPMFVAKDENAKLVLGNFSVEKKDVYNDLTNHFVGASLETMITGKFWDDPDCWEPPINKLEPEGKVEGDDAPPVSQR